jgi:hypothetical protein
MDKMNNVRDIADALTACITDVKEQRRFWNELWI